MVVFVTAAVPGAVGVGVIDHGTWGMTAQEFEHPFDIGELAAVVEGDCFDVGAVFEQQAQGFTGAFDGVAGHFVAELHAGGAFDEGEDDGLISPAAAEGIAFKMSELFAQIDVLRALVNTVAEFGFMGGGGFARSLAFGLAEEEDFLGGQVA